MTFRQTNLVLIFLLDSQTQEEVRRVLDFLEKELGIELFRRLFTIILTDGGAEFMAALNSPAEKNLRPPPTGARGQPYTIAIPIPSGKKDAAKRTMNISAMSGRREVPLTTWSSRI